MELRNDKNKASFPRTKKFLPSLALLLTNRIEQPETRIANKLFPNRPFAQRLSHNHQRLKSSLAICGRRQQKKNEVAEYRVLDDLQDKRTEQPILIFSHQHHSTAIINQQHSNDSKAYLSVPNKPIKQQKKQYLKKGSQLQKLIVINIVRSKLLREHSHERIADSIDDAERIVQVYNGTRTSQTSKSKDMPREVMRPRKEMVIKHKDCFRQINGWENEGQQDFDQTIRLQLAAATGGLAH